MDAKKYPLPRFHFKVEWDRQLFTATEVTGLVMEREKIEFRHCDSKEFSKMSMPGLVKTSNLTIKGPTFADDKGAAEWFALVADDRTESRSNIIISLLDETGGSVATWSAMRCFVVKYSASDLKSDANEIAILSLEVAHEGLTRTQ